MEKEVKLPEISDSTEISKLTETPRFDLLRHHNSYGRPWHYRLMMDIGRFNRYHRAVELFKAYPFIPRELADMITHYASPFYVGAQLDTRDYEGTWLNCSIVSVDWNNKRLKVKYPGYASKFNEQFAFSSESVEPVYYHIPPCEDPDDEKAASADLRSRDCVRVGSHLKVLDTHDEVMRALVLEVDLPRMQIKITYDSWGEKWDEWLPIHSHRIVRIFDDYRDDSDSGDGNDGGGDED